MQTKICCIKELPAVLTSQGTCVRDVRKTTRWDDQVGILDCCFFWVISHTRDSFTQSTNWWLHWSWNGAILHEQLYFLSVDHPSVKKQKLDICFLSFFVDINLNQTIQNTSVELIIRRRWPGVTINKMRQRHCFPFPSRDLHSESKFSSL